jgi:hypothetical protein
MLDYEQILTVEVKEAFSRCNLTRSRITDLAQGINKNYQSEILHQLCTKKKTTEII